MNSPEISITDPRALAMIIPFVVLFIGMFAVSLLDKWTQKRSHGEMTRGIAWANLWIYCVNVFALLGAGVACTVLLVSDGSVEAAMMAPLAALCYALFIWVVVFKAFTPVREAVRVINSPKDR